MASTTAMAAASCRMAGTSASASAGGMRQPRPLLPLRPRASAASAPLLRPCPQVGRRAHTVLPVGAAARGGLTRRRLACRASSAASTPEPSPEIAQEEAAKALEVPTMKEPEVHKGSELHHAIEAGLGSVVLLGCTALSMVLANTAMAPVWNALWATPLGPAIGGHTLTVHGWINEGLMAVFFFVVGLEIKRECVFGALKSIKQSILPCMAALGGMVFPMGIYCMINAAKGGIMAGWAIPMATDIAFACGIFAFFNKKMPRSASAFLLTLATVDDLGAIAVIALFFANNISVPFLAASAAVTAAMFMLPKLSQQVRVWQYAVGGVALWYCLLCSGVNADIAGVVAALAIPGTAPAPPASEAEPLEPDMKPTLMDHLIHKLLPYTALIVMPLFALANTAVAIDMSMISALVQQPVAVGIAAGLLLGKPLGITAFSLASIKAGIASWPEGMELKHLLVCGLLAGVGFTMCLFLITLALTATPDAMRLAKLAVIAASAVAGTAAAAIMNTFPENEDDSKLADSGTPGGAPVLA
uniref:Na+/H+ antiporter NhaA n=1 Tax=Pyramimonas obovata TaxID=1411642 RepID=A0A7S0N6E7_9CHLO|mmetsp:Transcript_21879/g.48034  ORF Transcript_21879/g.48034 Transcript_21879/m.48034 type:complete len:530 (+) Transcript_21879:190-1779(+)